MCELAPLNSCSGRKGRGIAQRILDKCKVLGNPADGDIRAGSWCQGELAKQAQKVKEDQSVKLHWPKTGQFINDSIFTLINSKGSLYQRKGSLSPSLLGHHRNCAGQVGAGQGRRVRNCQNTKSLHRACKGSSRADCSELWPLLRQGMLPFMALALRDEAGRVGISHAGVSDQGKSAF